MAAKREMITSWEILHPRVVEVLADNRMTVTQIGAEIRRRHPTQGFSNTLLNQVLYRYKSDIHFVQDGKAENGAPFWKIDTETVESSEGVLQAGENVATQTDSASNANDDYDDEVPTAVNEQTGDGAVDEDSWDKDIWLWATKVKSMKLPEETNQVIDRFLHIAAQIGLFDRHDILENATQNTIANLEKDFKEDEVVNEKMSHWKNKYHDPRLWYNKAEDKMNSFYWDYGVPFKHLYAYRTTCVKETVAMHTCHLHKNGRSVLCTPTAVEFKERVDKNPFTRIADAVCGDECVEFTLQHIFVSIPFFSGDYITQKMSYQQVVRLCIIYQLATRQYQHIFGCDNMGRLLSSSVKSDNGTIDKSWVFYHRLQHRTQQLVDYLAAWTGAVCSVSMVHPELYTAKSSKKTLVDCDFVLLDTSSIRETKETTIVVNTHKFPLIHSSPTTTTTKGTPADSQQDQDENPITAIVGTTAGATSTFHDMWQKYAFFGDYEGWNWKTIKGWGWRNLYKWPLFTFGLLMDVVVLFTAAIATSFFLLGYRLYQFGNDLVSVFSSAKGIRDFFSKAKTHVKRNKGVYFIFCTLIVITVAATLHWAHKKRKDKKENEVLQGNGYAIMAQTSRLSAGVLEVIAGVCKLLQLAIAKETTEQLAGAYSTAHGLTTIFSVFAKWSKDPKNDNSVYQGFGDEGKNEEKDEDVTKPVVEALTKAGVVVDEKKVKTSRKVLSWDSETIAHWLSKWWPIIFLFSALITFFIVYLCFFNNDEQKDEKKGVDQSHSDKAPSITLESQPQKDDYEGMTWREKARFAGSKTQRKELLRQKYGRNENDNAGKQEMEDIDYYPNRLPFDERKRVGQVGDHLRKYAPAFDFSWSEHQEKPTGTVDLHSALNYDKIFVRVSGFVAPVDNTASKRLININNLQRLMDAEKDSASAIGARPHVSTDNGRRWRILIEKPHPQDFESLPDEVVEDLIDQIEKDCRVTFQESEMLEISKSKTPILAAQKLARKKLAYICSSNNGELECLPKSNIFYEGQGIGKMCDLNELFSSVFRVIFDLPHAELGNCVLTKGGPNNTIPMIITCAHVPLGRNFMDKQNRPLPLSVVATLVDKHGVRQRVTLLKHMDCRPHDLVVFTFAAGVQEKSWGAFMAGRRPLDFFPAPQTGLGFILTLRGAANENPTEALAIANVIAAGDGVIAHTGTTAMGDSGSPLFNKDGRLIGIHHMYNGLCNKALFLRTHSNDTQPVQIQKKEDKPLQITDSVKPKVEEKKSEKQLESATMNMIPPTKETELHVANVKYDESYDDLVGQVPITPLSEIFKTTVPHGVPVVLNHTSVSQPTSVSCPQSSIGCHSSGGAQ